MELPGPTIKKAGRSLLLLSLIGMAGLYFWFDPKQVSIFPPCPFKLLTGLDCPGCGSQRCLHQLMHGHIRRAYSYNPLLVLSLPYCLLGLLLEYTALREKYAGFRQRFYGRTAALLIFRIVIIFWIGRNWA